MELIHHEQLKLLVAKALETSYRSEQLGDNLLERLIVERPKDESFGDVAIPLFDFAKQLRLSPAVIAKQVVEQIKKVDSSVHVVALSGYVNFFWHKDAFTREILSSMHEGFGQNESLSGEKIIVEFSGPNTNKPLHLGHMRNNVLGESLSRILKNAGAELFKVNIVNDRGVHICKSMLAYQMFGEGATPESTQTKSDHFVGDYYVKYAQWEKEHPEVENEIQAMLHAWEAGDAQVLELWKKMNHWAVSGIAQTYERTGVSFDKIYYESETYKLGKDIVLAGAQKGVFFKAEDGSLRLDVSEITPEDKNSDELPTKVFLRADGTSIYITQDLGTAVARYEDFPFDRMIYVVAHEQRRHFEILFYALDKMGYPWAKQLHHLSYGMVNLPDGKMKSREGTVVDADDLLDTLTEQALLVSENAQRKADDGGKARAFDVALGALHYFLLQINPVKDMVFNAQESLSFTGNTGPYLQYTYARIAGMLRRSEARSLVERFSQPNYTLLNHDVEWRLVKILADFPAITQKAALEYSPSVIAVYLYELSKQYNKFYTDLPIFKEDNLDVAAMRLLLSDKVRLVLKRGLELLVIPVVEQM
ncbi:arginine--tRNA ligase [Entomospira culicis]|uniref:Arginine--tRNA ligase n=1 Tax=Entomospira culicis TaxID=2719989 RepID=A0A968KVD2_9SPIO|nr:arginine--tRNA ligase [Entomospira culicis]NIZ18763.1 arginine--tRNA ligase [Entomospira culicis]NIZ68978.1 arginine--tRNA ligase [Entomospira culicis]WDI37569.1 arginine--tRNA ligase [Entomospira culicis]WDI39197.1 arginine--tRNA ligase [Entomospira culicis]